jgi:hypothetical protein
MADRSFVRENEASRVELSELIGRLDERSFRNQVGAGWTICTALCHLAFWDQRVLFLLREWERSGPTDSSRLGSQSTNSINHAVNAISRAVLGPAAAELALSSALAVDSYVAALGDDLVDQLVSAGFERYLKRYLHRREHMQRILKALDRGAAGAA